MASEIAKAYVQIVPSADGIGTSLNSIMSSAGTSAGLTGGTAIGNGVLGNMTKLLKGVGVTAAVSAVVKALKGCVDEASEFDAGMSQVAATMGTTTDEISDLSEFAKEMGRTTAFSATEAADGLNTLALAGLDADEQMAVLPDVMNLASAGCLSLDEAASYVTGSIKGFGDEMDNADYYADLMAKGATLASTDVNDLGEALSGSAATANAYGQEADSVTLSLLRLAEQNVTGSEATTALNRAMSDLYTPTDAAKGALDDLGVSCYDAEGNARDFNDVIDDLDDALAGYDDQTKNAYTDTIFTTQGLQAFNKMTATSTDKVNDFKTELADCSGSAMDQAATQLDNLQGDMTLFESAMSGLKIAVGEALTPVCRAFTQFGTAAITTFTEIITGSFDWQGALTGAINTVVDAFGIADWPGIGDLIKNGIGGGIADLVESVPGAISEFVQSIAKKIEDTDWAAMGYDAACKIIGGLEDIIKDIPGAIESITSNIVQFLKNVDWKQVGYDVMTTLLTGIKLIIADIPQAIGELVQSIWKRITETNWIELGGNIVKGIINGITSLIPQALSSIGDFCSGLFKGFTDFFGISSPSTLMEEQGGYLVDGLVLGASEMPTCLDETFTETVDGITTFGETASDAMTGASEGVVDSITSSYGEVPALVKDPLSEAADTITGWGKDTKSDMKTYTSGALSNLDTNFGQVPGTVSSSLSSATSQITSWGASTQSSGGNIGKQFVAKVSDGMKDLANKVSARLKDATSKVTAWQSSFTNEGTTVAKAFVKDFNTEMKDLKTNTADALDAVLTKAGTYESKMSSEGSTLGKNLVQGMIDGINSKSSSLYSTISSVVNKAVKKANEAAGTSSPSKKLKWTGEMMDRGLALGLSSYSGLVDSAMDDVMSIVDQANDANYSASVRTAAGNTGNAGNTYNITQNIYSEAKSAAALMKEARNQARRAVIQGV